jgi:hypothetical protein
MSKEASSIRQAHPRGRRGWTARLWRGGLLAASGWLSLWPSVAGAATCVAVDEERDGLSAEERQATRTLFEESLGENGVAVAREGCTETWSIYHVRLGKSVTAIVQGPKGTRRERVNSIEDLPGTYSQMVRSLLHGVDNTAESSAVDRRNVTKSQSQRRRISADAIWYAKLGYGATPAAGLHGGPAFGFGRRWELDHIGINLGFLNFIMYQDSDEFEGLSAGWIELGADYFFDAFANGSAYVGAGLSLGNHSIPEGGGTYENAGLQGKASLGYEVFRASTVRLLGQLDATLPMFQLARTSFDAATLVEQTDHVYAPTFTLTLGLGWGARPN